MFGFEFNKCKAVMRAIDLWSILTSFNWPNEKEHYHTTTAVAPNATLSTRNFDPGFALEFDHFFFWTTPARSVLLRFNTSSLKMCPSRMA